MDQSQFPILCLSWIILLVFFSPSELHLSINESVSPPSFIFCHFIFLPLSRTFRRNCSLNPPTLHLFIAHCCCSVSAPPLERNPATCFYLCRTSSSQILFLSFCHFSFPSFHFPLFVFLCPFLLPLHLFLLCSHVTHGSQSSVFLFVSLLPSLLSLSFRYLMLLSFLSLFSYSHSTPLFLFCPLYFCHSLVIFLSFLFFVPPIHVFFSCSLSLPPVIYISPLFFCLYPLYSCPPFHLPLFFLPHTIPFFAF